jgi:hypothetical protein
MLNKIKKGLKEVLKDIEDRFDEVKYPIKDDVPHWSEYSSETDEGAMDNYDPYEGASWGKAENWHCIRCGSHLKEIDKNDLAHGEVAFHEMRKHRALWYQCSNEKCFHNNAPLILHHPLGGYTAAPGESYSISWVR